MRDRYIVLLAVSIVFSIFMLSLGGCSTNYVSKPSATITVPEVCIQQETIREVLQVQKKCLITLIDNHNKQARCEQPPC